jgi:6-phosphogluconolactonase
MDRLNVFADPAAVALASARSVAETLTAIVAAKGRCRLALAGGSTPRATYEQLAVRSVGGSVDWANVDVFFGDERMVPPEDVASNYRMAHESLLGRVPIPPENVHRITGEIGAAEAARRYVAELGAEPLDLVLLGMGDDGHVASLFPGSRALETPYAPALPSEAPVPPHSRVTLSLPVINSASEVLFIVTGPGKAAPLREVFGERRSGHPALPASRVGSSSGRTDWFLDAAAAALLGEVT